MKREQLFDAITDLRDDLIEGALKPLKKRHIRWLAPVAAVVTIVLTITAIVQPGRNLIPDPSIIDTPIEDTPSANEQDHPQKEDLPDSGPLIVAHAIAEATPKFYPNEELDQEQVQQTVNRFTQKTLAKILGNTEDQNSVYSPASLFLSLATLTEITGDEAKAEILKSAGFTDAAQMQEQAKQLWDVTQSDFLHGKFQMANSIWLDSDVSYKEAPLKRLATEYYASSFQGTMGNEDYEELLRNWIKKETGGMSATDGEENFFTSNTFFAFLNAFYLHTEWASPFNEEHNFTAPFYGANGEETVEYMTNQDVYDVFQGEHFSALTKQASYGELVIFLPEKGTDTEQLLKDQAFLSHLTDPTYRGNMDTMCFRKLVLPKFDVASSLSLIQPLQRLGIQKIFKDDAENFAPLLEENQEGCVQKFTQDIRFTVDEKGCIAAGYTFYDGQYKSAGAGTGEDFIVDRPFVFSIRYKGIPLFIGVVNNV